MTTIHTTELYPSLANTRHEGRITSNVMKIEVDGKILELTLNIGFRGINLPATIVFDAEGKGIVD